MIDKVNLSVFGNDLLTMRWDSTEMGLLIEIFRRWEGVGSRGGIKLNRTGIVAGEFGRCYVIAIVFIVVVEKYVEVRRVPKRGLVVIGWWL